MQNIDINTTFAGRYETVTLTTASFCEKVVRMQNRREIVTASGANLVNVLFARPAPMLKVIRFTERDVWPIKALYNSIWKEKLAMKEYHFNGSTYMSPCK